MKNRWQIQTDSFSNWPRLCGRFRTVFRATRVLKRSIKRDMPCKLDDFAADKNKARNFLLRISQSKHLKDNVSRLQSGLPIDQKDKLLPCVPFPDSDGLFRIGGRIQKSGLLFQSKHPVILHSKCRVAKLFIEKAHHDCGNYWIELVRAHIQPTFMIVGIRRALGILRKYCFIWRPCRADKVRPKMAPLPNFHFPALQTLPFCEYWNGHVRTFSHWKIQNPDRTQLCLHVYMLGHTSSTLGSLWGPLHWLSANGYSTFCIQTSIPWYHCFGQREKLCWS